MPRAFIGLGSNLGDRHETLMRALDALSRDPAIHVVAVSAFRETDPVGVVEQPRFVNAAAVVETDLPPRVLLERILTVERELGRVRGPQRHGPRTVDLDLLLYGDEVVAEPGLRVPHPRLHEREFVLEPLHELDPTAVVPGHGPVDVLLRRVRSGQVGR